jgi:hypothetical protein
MRRQAGRQAGSTGDGIDCAASETDRQTDRRCLSNYRRMESIKVNTGPVVLGYRHRFNVRSDKLTA